MIILSLTAGNSTENVNLPIIVKNNTNDDITLSNNTLQLTKPGVYEIVGNATITSIAAGNYGVQVNVNGSVNGNPAINDATGASETTTVPIYSSFVIDKSNTSGNVTVSLTPVGAPTIVGGTVSVKKFSFM